MLSSRIKVSAASTAPVLVSVLAGASSLWGGIEAQTCLGNASAMLILTLPVPVSLSLSARDGRHSLVPSGNVADDFVGRQAFTDLIATVAFEDASTREMQTDPRLRFNISDECVNFGTSGSYIRLERSSNCRTSSITVIATQSLGDMAVTGSRAIRVEWLAALTMVMYQEEKKKPIPFIHWQHTSSTKLAVGRRETHLNATTQSFAYSSERHV